MVVAAWAGNQLQQIIDWALLFMKTTPAGMAPGKATMHAVYIIHPTRFHLASHCKHTARPPTLLLAHYLDAGVLGIHFACCPPRVDNRSTAPSPYGPMTVPQVDGAEFRIPARQWIQVCDVDRGRRRASCITTDVGVFCGTIRAR